MAEAAELTLKLLKLGLRRGPQLLEVFAEIFVVPKGV